MTSPSKIATLVAAALLGAALAGCGSSSDGTGSAPAATPVDATAAAKIQPGAGGKKAAAGGGLADDSIVPPKAGETGLVGGKK